jgi:hypothetical protein
VDLDLKKAVVLFGEFVEFTMLCKTFDNWLCGHDVEAALEGCFDDLVVRVVGRENAADVAGFEIFKGLICTEKVPWGSVDWVGNFRGGYARVCAGGIVNGSCSMKEDCRSIRQRRGGSTP